MESKHNHLEWDPPEDIGGSSLQNYLIYRGTRSDDLKFLYFQAPSQTFKDDGSVEPGRMYYYAVTARNKVGESPFSEVVSSIMRYAPTQPLNLSAISGMGFVNVSWIAPVDNGGSDILRYELYRSEGTDGEYSLLVSLSNISLYFNDTSVNNGVPYNYKIRGNNSFFDSVFSNVVSGYPATVPDGPSDLEVVSGDNYLDVRWDVPAFDGGYPVTSYMIEKVHFDNGTFIEKFQTSSLSVNDTNVTNGVRYGYRVRAINQIGSSPFTDWVEGKPIGVPSIPIGGNVRSGDGYVQLNWQMPESDGGSPVIGFRVYRNGTLMRDLELSILSYNDTTVENGKVYEYIITSFNEKGESPRIVILYGHPKGSTIIIEKHPPGVPGNLRYQLNQGKIVLNWDEPEYKGTSEIIGYLVYMKVGDHGEFDLVGRVKVRSFVDTNGTVPGIYYYRVSAFSSDGEGNRTDPVRVEIKDEEASKPTPIWFYLVPAVVLICLVILIAVVLVVKRRGAEQKVLAPQGHIAEE
ncbi:MAG: fibronectin type III domain-containing protein [Candidatus Thermoplasmatota archaeon]|nr:fibronectin type III domain-containing protein [Candidatus Thermoplasmatota archaeon]